MAGKDTDKPAPVTRPLPSLSELDTAEFWQATKQQCFKYQQCERCNTVVWHPRAHCTGCINGKLEWRESAGLGEVYTYSIVRQSYHPFFRNKVPYAVVYVDLDEGPRFLTNIVGVSDPTNDVKIGMRVRLNWEIHAELSIPLVEPLEDYTS